MYKDYAYTSLIAVLGGEGIIIPGGDLDPGLVKDISVKPKEDGVQIVTDYMIKFETEHTLNPPAGLKIEFPTAIILPPTGTVVKIYPQLPSKDYIVAETGTIVSGNIIKIDNLFGGAQPPAGPMVIELLIEGIQNPYSSKPAGNISIETFYEEDMVDTGTSDGSFTPTSGIMTGIPIVVTKPYTSGKES